MIDVTFVDRGTVEIRGRDVDGKLYGADISKARWLRTYDRVRASHPDRYASGFTLEQDTAKAVLEKDFRGVNFDQSIDYETLDPGDDYSFESYEATNA